jgi:hypothetical protein
MNWFHWAPGAEEACVRCLPCSDRDRDGLLGALADAGYASRRVARLGKRLECWSLDARFAQALDGLHIDFSSDLVRHLEEGGKARLWRKVAHRAFRPRRGEGPASGPRTR